jgi:hypothetical protein
LQHGAAVIDVDVQQEALFLALAQTEDAVSRLDEQARFSPVAAGWRNRLDFQEAAAWAWSSNELAPVEDLVLHDARLDVRIPTQGLGRAHGLIRARRKAAIGGLELVQAEGALWLAARQAAPPTHRPERGSPPARPEGVRLLPWLGDQLDHLSQGVTDGPKAALTEWSTAVTALEGHAPDLLIAAFALDAWRIVQPLPREDYVGAILTAVWLGGRRRTSSHLLGLQVGLRKLGPLPSRIAEGPAPGRLTFYLKAILAAAQLGGEDLRRLGLVRQLMVHQIGDRRKGSRAADLAELLLSLPLVSAPMAAERLGISQQAVRALVPALGSSVRERTGRRRFKAWAV